jgi:hypothetical protein
MPVTPSPFLTASSRTVCSQSSTPACDAHLEKDDLHHLGVERRERAADAGGVRQVPASATLLGAAVNHLLREAAHHLLAAAIMKRGHVREREASAAEVAGLLDEASPRARARGGDRRDRT